MYDINEVYNLMPTSGRVGILQRVFQWFKEVSDPKIASDLIQLGLKSLPLVGLIVSPLILGTLYWFRESIVKLYTDNNFLFWVIFTIIFTYLCIYAITMINEARLNKKLIQLDVHRSYKIIQHVACAKIISTSEAVYAFRWIVKVRNGSETRFPVLYNWSGQGEVKIIPRNKRYKVEIIGRGTGGFTKAEIILDRTVSTGQEIEIEYLLHATSKKDDPPNPYFALSSFCKKYPSFNTRLLVSFSKEVIPISIYREYFFASTALGAIKTVTVGLDENDSHHWSVRSINGWFYCIRWEFGV
jgi:hypothetical protein